MDKGVNMKLQVLIDKLNLAVLTNIVNRETDEAYFSDLHSDTMSHARQGNLWVTTQTDKNVVSAAHLLDISAVIVQNGETVPQDTIELANRFKVVILASALPVVDLARKLNTAGLGIKAEAKYSDMLEEVLQAREETAPCSIYSNIFDAVENNDISGVEKFITEGADINSTDATGATPLHWAAFNDLPDLLEFLISHGANIYAHDDDGWTPMHWAKSKKVLEFLISNGADVNTRDQFGQTPLHLLSMESVPDIIGFLLSKGASINVKDSMGKTPLHFAALKGNAEVIKFLISQNAQVNAQEDTGKSPLHLATIKGHKEASESLIRQGAERTAKDNDGKTPIDYATERGHKHLIDVLQKNR